MCVCVCVCVTEVVRVRDSESDGCVKRFAKIAKVKVILKSRS